MSSFHWRHFDIRAAAVNLYHCLPPDVLRPVPWRRQPGVTITSPGYYLRQDVVQDVPGEQDAVTVTARAGDGRHGRQPLVQLTAQLVVKLLSLGLASAQLQLLFKLLLNSLDVMLLFFNNHP